MGAVLAYPPPLSVCSSVATTQLQKQKSHGTCRFSWIPTDLQDQPRNLRYGPHPRGRENPLARLDERPQASRFPAAELRCYYNRLKSRQNRATTESSQVMSYSPLGTKAPGYKERQTRGNAISEKDGPCMCLLALIQLCRSGVG